MDVILILLSHTLFIFLVLRFWINRHPQGQPFRFYIVDYWAAVIGLVPTFLLIANVSTDGWWSDDDAARWHEWLSLYSGVYFVGTGQIAGMIMARTSDSYIDDGPQSFWTHFWVIITGAVAGCFLPMIGFLCLPVLISLVLMSPLAALVWLLVKLDQRIRGE
jgi:hypothetical protein